MKIIFLVLTIQLMIFSLVLIVAAIRKKDAMSIPIAALLGTTFFVALSYILGNYVSERNLSYLMHGVYFVSLDWLLIFMLSYVLKIHRRTMRKNSGNIFITICGVIASLDAVSMILNVPLRHAFSLNYYEASPTEWYLDSVPGWGFYVHIAFCYLLSICIFIVLLRAIRRYPAPFRKGYYWILGSFIVALIVNVLSKQLQLHLNLSSLLFIIIAQQIYHLNYIIIPKESETQMLRMISKDQTAALVCFDKDERCIHVNAAALRLFEVEANQKAVAERYLSLWKEIYNLKDEDYVKGKDVIELEGAEHIFEVEYHRLRDYRNRIQGASLTFVDNTSKIEKLKEQQYRATHDALTGIFNRTTFFERAMTILQNDPEKPRYMIATNICGFKLINEYFGTKFGDEVLVNQATLLKHVDYEDYICGRISADHFALLMNKEDYNTELAENFSKKLQNISEHLSYQIRVVMGIYEIANPYENAHYMYDKATLAIQNAKSNTSERIVFYDTLLMERLIHKKNVLTGFESALREQQYCIYLQPQVDPFGKVLGGEALVRWKHPEKGLVPPYQFIPILEETGYIYRLDYYVWELAVKKLLDWKNRGLSDYYISVNISTKDFYYTDLYVTFTELVEQYGVEPGRLKLEITETSLLKDFRQHKETLERLAAYGFNIEMDDFGSGYSSLKLLEDLPVDVLKIDMEFLRKTENEERAKIIIRSIIKMAEDLGMQVVTEGVEEKEQAEFLTEYGCKCFQGYYFSKPIPVTDFEEKYLGGQEG